MANDNKKIYQNYSLFRFKVEFQDSEVRHWSDFVLVHVHHLLLIATYQYAYITIRLLKSGQSKTNDSY